MKCYQIVAQTERMKTGRPCAKTVANVLHGATNVSQAAGVELTERVDALTRQKIDLALGTFMHRGLSRLSAWSYIWQLRGLFGKWCLPYYHDAGWDIPKLDIPVFRARAPRYARPSDEMLKRVKAWYATLDGAKWLAATMMLEFAMRNGDVLRLKDENFVGKKTTSAPDGRQEPPSLRHYLVYTPHKTALSSGRRVCWPVHESIWAKLQSYGGFRGVDVTDETFGELNRELRDLGFRGTKASYELRKICIDHVYQRFGAEMAVSISGDDIRTISKYYADTAQPNIGTLRVLDLL